MLKLPIKRSDVSLLSRDNGVNYWIVSYVLDTKSKHYQGLLDTVVSFCNDDTSVSGDSTRVSIGNAYNRVRNVKPMHSVEHDAIKHVETNYLLSYKNLFKRPKLHEVKLTVRWSEGKNYIRDIDNKINEYLKKHCLFPTKLKVEKEE